MIRADATQIHQVLLNLCLNARDAMPAGGNLSIRTTTVGHEMVVSQFPRAIAREYVLVSVADTGTGMDEETKQKIFDPFFTTKGPGKGTGLGLALARSIVEVHQGIIDVKSAPNKGTTFTIYLPVEEKAPDSFRDSTSQRADLAGGTETILLIEDEEMLRDMTKAALLAKGYDVLTARDGEEGLEMYHRHNERIALVFTDLGLPKIAGDEVSRRIKAVNANLPVIIASGFIDPALKSEMLGTVFNEIIQKPYSAIELLRVIRATIDKTK
jgi:two-component system cell cycle sensor histidine kinase/response regulator CckA